MKGVREGFFGLLKKELLDPESLTAFHCISYQQNLAAKSTTVEETFNKVLAIVNFITVNSTRHRQFRELLINDDETKYVQPSLLIISRKYTKQKFKVKAPYRQFL